MSTTEIETTTINSKPRVLSATWTVDSMANLSTEFGAPLTRRCANLIPRFKGRCRTVKQRNKKLTSHFIGSRNRNIMHSRGLVAKEKEIANILAAEIRSTIDDEVLNMLFS
jgi:hypothetical protein